jgi:hypothetical protein
VRWVVLSLVAAVLLVVGWAVWKGPSAALRWAVRTYDPALRLKIGNSFYREGEWVLQKVGLTLRGSREPVFEAREVRLGPGPRWRSGQFGSLRLVEPFVRLDRNAVAHFSQGAGGSGGGVPWEIGEVAIERGHLWAENFGESGVDISAGIDGTMTSLGPAQGDERHRLTVYNFYLASHDPAGSLPVMGAGQSQLNFTMAGLQRGRISGIRVDEGWMIAGVGLERLMAEGDGASAGQPGSALVIESLDLINMQVQPDGLPGGLPAISLQVNTALRDVPLGAVADELGEIKHQVEFSDIELLSPTDPLRRAVTVRSAFVIFTLAGLARRDLEEVKLIGPTVYVGEPLFEYMQTADELGKAPEPVKESEGWNVDTLRVNFGRVVLAVGGRSQVGLPLAFHTMVRNLSLSSLAGLNVEFVLKVPEEDYEFPAYDISLNKVRGDLLFNYPPDILRNNLVNVVKMDRARWRNFRASDLWVSVTFDSKGINGDFGGRAYGGYVNGGFSFFLQPDSPWTGWISGQDVDLAPLTADGAPQHFVMDGLADFKVEANGRAAAVERVRGEISGQGKGRMVVNKLNDLLQSMPPEWAAVKRELSRVSLETLRDFDYTEAKSEFWFVGRQGIIDIRMKGPSGSRNLELVFHGSETDREARWQQGGRR